MFVYPEITQKSTFRQGKHSFVNSVKERPSLAPDQRNLEGEIMSTSRTFQLVSAVIHSSCVFLIFLS